MRPTYVQALVDKAEALEKLSRYEEALDLYDKALGIEEDNFDAWFSKGQLLLFPWKNTRKPLSV